MRWFSRLFGSASGEAPASRRQGQDHCGDLAGAVVSADRMLATLLEAYGEDSPLVRSQRSYIETLRRELSACRAA